MKLNAHISLAFSGQCEAAFRLYEQSLNGTIAFMLTWGQSPAAADAPADWGTKIYHATLNVGDTTITGGDLPPDRYEQPKGFSLVLQMDDAVAAQRIFDALAEHGTIKLPLRETFWAGRYGVLVDRFGVPWEINCEKAVESNP